MRNPLPRAIRVFLRFPTAQFSLYMCFRIPVFLLVANCFFQTVTAQTAASAAALSAISNSTPVEITTYLISVRESETFSQAMLDSVWKANKVPQFISPVRYGVQVYQVMYWTHWHDGSKIKASGLYFVPVEKRSELPVVCYNHGSQSERDIEVSLKGEAVIPTALAADGYAALMPDYIGLGAGEKIHLYHHAETEAGATLDMLRAVQEINAQLGISTDGHLFLSGYSQGGHASMATHKMIEEQFPNEFSLTASAPMSGAYDMSGVQARAMFGSYDRPAYFPFLLWGMNEAYGILPDIRAAIKEEYADTLMAMLENQHYSLRQISRVMPSVPAEIIRPEFLQAYSSDSTFPMRLAMEENSLIDWAPQKPMMICYCKADEQVDYRNALVAYDSMKELGSKSVMLRRAGKNFGHEACALYASVYTKMYFDSFLKGSKNGKKGPVSKRFLISLGKIGGE